MNTTDKLAEALRAMLTHMGMDEDEWNKPTFDQARAALAAYEAEAKPAEPVAWTLQETLDKRETTCSARLWFTNPRNDAWVPLYTAPAAITNAAQPVHPDERADLAERIEAAHEASLDDDHRACQSILKECLKMLAFPKAAPMTGPKVAFWVYEWLHPTDGSVTLRSLCPEDHCRKPDRAIPVPLMDEWVQWAKAAAPAPDHIADASKLVAPLLSVHLTRDTSGMCVVSLNGFEVIRDNGDVIDHMATPSWLATYAAPAAPAEVPELVALLRLVEEIAGANSAQVAPVYSELAGNALADYRAAISASKGGAA
jgi:hypothetical protein